MKTYYNNNREILPETSGIVESITRDQYEELVSKTITNSGCLWPDTIMYSWNFDYKPSIFDLIHMLERREESSKAIEQYEFGIYLMSEEDKINIYRKLWLQLAPESYVDYLINLHHSEWDTKVILVKLGIYSSSVDETPRWPSFVMEGMKDKRRKVGIQYEILACDTYIKNSNLTRKEAIKLIETEYDIKMGNRNFSKIISKYNLQRSKKE